MSEIAGVSESGAVTLREAREALRAMGISLRSTEHGEYRVCPMGSGESMAYYTDDLCDAVETGKVMGVTGL